jgi:hypothetical protein
VKAFGSLEVVDDLEEIAGLRVAAWTEHAHQALGRPFCSATQLLEPNRRVDIVAKYRFPVSRSPARRHSTPSRRSSFLYLRSARRRACTVSLSSTVKSVAYVHTADIDPTVVKSGATWEGLANVCVTAAEKALDTPPKDYTPTRRNSLTDIFASMKVTHRSIRLLVALGDEKPESVDALVLARLQLDGLGLAQSTRLELSRSDR